MVSIVRWGCPDGFWRLRTYEATDGGPLIDEASAVRGETWIKEAVAGGAKLWAGGNRTGAFLPPALLENVPADAKLSCEEAFGPVATLEAADSRERALDKLAEGRYGLQAGLFDGGALRQQRVPVGQRPAEVLRVGQLEARGAQPLGERDEIRAARDVAAVEHHVERER